MDNCRTRNQSGNDVIGPSADLPQSDLPTLRDVLAYGMFLTENSLLKLSDDRDLAKQVCADLKKVWSRVNHKIVAPGVISPDKNIERKFVNDWEIMKKVQRNRRIIGKKREKIWKEKLDKAFNILVCHCPFLKCPEFGCKGCPDSIHLLCSCEARSKVPKMEIPFLHSQLTKIGTKGKITIGLVDKVESHKQSKALARKEKKEAASLKKDIKEKKEEEEKAGQVADWENNFQKNVDADCINPDEEFRSAATERLVKKTNQNRIKLSNMARVSLSCDVSISATAQIGTALLIDLGLVTAEDTSKIIDKSKIRRERDRIMKDLHQQGLSSLQEQTLKSFIFDGKRDSTKVLLEDEDGEQFPAVREVEHFTIVDGIDGSYLTHLDPDDGTGKSIAEKVHNWILSIGQEDNIQVIGGDSTGVNIGWKIGAIHWMEVLLGHKVMWSICQLHLNELGLRHLIVDLDGPTSSGNTFTGPVGKLLSDDVQDFVTNQNFKRIVVEDGIKELPEEVVKDLSNDQKHGYKLVQLITGKSQDISCLKLKPGPVCHARWLTTANRLMIIYCKKHGLRGKKVKTLSTLVNFIVSHYYKMWFEIKCAPRLIDGPRHLLKSIQLLAVATPEVKEIVMPVVQRGAYHGHSENVLLALLSSSDEKEREFAVDKIVEIRGGEEFGDKSVRDFHTPTLNWKASSVLDMIDWDDAVISEPILTCHMSTDEVMSLKEMPLVVENFCGHGLSVERAVKETSVASGKVFGFERRDGYIRAKVKSRKMVSRPQSKKDLIGMLS